MNWTGLEELADILLLQIRENADTTHAFEALARQHDATVAHVSEAVRLIDLWGYKMERESPETVRFLSAPDSLTATEILYGLKTRLMGQMVHSYQTVKSTNDIAVTLAGSGAPEGTIVTAEAQTQGRGRLGRSWHSPQNVGAYVSIILRPDFPPDHAPGLSIMTALALADTIEPHCPGKVKIKWPNDILIDSLKTAGILTELSADRQKINHVIVGVGINVNHTQKHFPDEISPIATSVRLGSGKKISRIALLQDFLARFETEYWIYRQFRLTQSVDRLRTYSSLIGRSIELAVGRETICGVVMEINHDGALVLKCGDKTRIISSGEVTLIKKQ